MTTKAGMKVNTTKRVSTMAQADGWAAAAMLLSRLLARPGRADEILAGATFTDARERARCERLLFGAIRNKALLGAAVDSLCRNEPTEAARAVMMIAGCELLECGDDAAGRALVTHHAVEKAKLLLPAKMHGFVNAVVRRLPDAMREVVDACADPVSRLALRHSHPEWLVRRWIAAHGMEATRMLLEWNQSPPPVHVRLRDGVAAPASLKATQWHGFYEYSGGDWREVEALLAARDAYAQDPSTRLCVGLLSPKPGMRILDLCASPGGKARMILDSLGPEGLLVCVDLPPRCERLRENLAPCAGGPRVHVLPADVMELNASALVALGLPAQYDAVLLDAPCTNTGVLRRRADARWRLKEDDIVSSAALQGRLLAKAAEFVATRGTLVYSTCSIEREENAAVVEAFSAANPAFEPIASVSALPWREGHDGAGAASWLRG